MSPKVPLSVYAPGREKTHPAQAARFLGISQLAGSEMAGLLPKRLEGDQLLSKTVMIENLSIRMSLKSEGVKGGYVWRDQLLTHTGEACKGVGQEERRRIQRKQQASWNFSTWREWTMRLLPKRLEGDQLPSEIVATEILPIRMQGLFRVEDYYVFQIIVGEASF